MLPITIHNQKAFSIKRINIFLLTFTGPKTNILRATGFRAQQPTPLNFFNLTLNDVSFKMFDTFYNKLAHIEIFCSIYLLFNERQKNTSLCIMICQF